MVGEHAARDDMCTSVAASAPCSSTCEQIERLLSHRADALELLASAGDEPPSVERRLTAPLVALRLLRNGVLVGTTLAIPIGVGTINAPMYVASPYFEDTGLGMTPLEAGRRHCRRPPDGYVRKGWSSPVSVDTVI